MKLVKEIYRISANFPHLEQYGLTSQIRRSAVSIPSNIAEGKNRNSKLEFKRFINIALGSTAELETQIILSNDLGYIEEKTKNEVSEQLAENTPETTTKPKQNNNNLDFIYYTVRHGDTLWKIAQKHDGSTVEQIKKLNNISNEKSIKPGQKIKVAVVS